jgi:hypothetical protein
MHLRKTPKQTILIAKILLLAACATQPMPNTGNLPGQRDGGPHLFSFDKAAAAADH